MKSKRCPTPWKQAHSTRDAAHAHAYSLRKAKPTIDERPYQCQCGAWHVGARKHNKPRTTR